MEEAALLKSTRAESSLVLLHVTKHMPLQSDLISFLSFAVSLTA